MKNPEYPYDVFLSHASDDCAAFVDALHAALTARGLEVWYSAIALGESISQAIRAGLVRSRFGVVVLSPNYFRYWPELELSALFALESVTETKKILPVTLDLSWKDLIRRDPLVGARLHVSAELGADAVADKIAEAVRAG